jgi:Mn2+/Fe2+ NRAMP family transporter
MICRSILLFVLALTLTGCVKADQKIVDLSAAVFMVFLALVGLKYAIPVVVSSRLGKHFLETLKRNIRFFILPLFAIAICLVIAGFYLSGIHGVLIFFGLVVGVITVFLRLYATHETQENKKRMLEIVVLGMSILVVLALLWMFGASIFSGF